MLKQIKNNTSVNSTQEITPDYPIMKQMVESICYFGLGKVQWYPPLMLSAEALSKEVLKLSSVQEAAVLLQCLNMDDYCKYLFGYYQEGIKRFGAGWCYADIVTVLLALAKKIQPKNYLEIGVRRGRSVCAVASKMPQVDLYMFDMWISNYAGMENPGEGMVNAELNKFSHRGKREFYNGNSHQMLKGFFKEKPDLAFDMITVDGDHTYAGAAEDLSDVLPRLKIGGAVIFDDICHPKHMYLQDVWKRMVEDDKRFTAWSYKDIGYGVGFALRKW